MTRGDRACVVVVGLLRDLLDTLRHRHTTRPRTIQIRGGFVSLPHVAALLGITASEVQRRMQQMGCSAGRSPDGDEALSLDDVRAIARE